MKRVAVTTEEVEAKSWEHAQKLLFQDAWDQEHRTCFSHCDSSFAASRTASSGLRPR